MDRPAIEYEARKLHNEIWHQRSALWPSSQPPAVDMLAPHVGAHVLGIDYQLMPDLRSLERRAKQYQIAGVIERQFNRIVISEKFPRETQRFTGAHELGHWLLHPNQNMHRDRPVNGLRSRHETRPVLEQEADYFAACYLMPRKLVLHEFENRFGLQPLIINYDNAFELSGGGDFNALLYPDAGSLACELAVATARSFRGRHFDSLARTFRVSPSSMAIRLEEMGLVQK